MSIPVGTAVHTGEAFVGATGLGTTVDNLTAFGDAANITARLASAAAAGEVIVSVAAAEVAGMATDQPGVRVFSKYRYPVERPLGLLGETLDDGGAVIRVVGLVRWSVCRTFGAQFASAAIGRWCVSAILSSMSLDPVVTNPEQYKVVFENDRVRVLEYLDEPGHHTTPHRHPDSVMYTLTSFRRRLVSGGLERDVELSAGAVGWLSAQEHSGENIGDTPTHVLFVELKETVSTGGIEAASDLGPQSS